MKPAGWPANVQEKRLRSGAVAYYWNIRDRYITAGCPLRRCALGTDYAEACRRAGELNEAFEAWKLGAGGPPIEEAHSRFGTVAWLVHRYLHSNAYKDRVGQRSRYEYERALRRIEDLTTKTGGTVGQLPVASIDAPAVDKIYTRLKTGPRGQRTRQANLSIDIAARAWDVVRRLAPSAVPVDNPWRGVLQDRSKRTKGASSRVEAYTLAAALKAAGEPHLGAAALICFEWHQRPEHVLGGDLTWNDYHPGQKVMIRHPKTGEKGWIPLVDGHGPLFPELEAYLADLPRLGIPIVLTAARRGPARPYSSEYAGRRVREARAAAQLGEHVTLDTCRHGGLTELGDAGLSESQEMALSMHRTPQAKRRYVKHTEAQRMSGARLRRRLVERTS